MRKLAHHIPSQLLAIARASSRVREDFLMTAPPPLDRVCRCIGLRGEVLILAAESAVWSTRARFLSRDIIKSLRERGHRVRQLRILLVPTVQRPAPNSPAEAPEAAGELLQSHADRLDDDRLSRALTRLARATRKRRSDSSPEPSPKSEPSLK